MNQLFHERRKESAKFRQRKAAFEQLQIAKRKSWNKADEQGLSKLNLPQIQPGNKMLQSASLNEASRITNTDVIQL